MWIILYNLLYYIFPNFYIIQRCWIMASRFATTLIIALNWSSIYEKIFYLNKWCKYSSQTCQYIRRYGSNIQGVWSILVPENMWIWNFRIYKNIEFNNKWISFFLDLDVNTQKKLIEKTYKRQHKYLSIVHLFKFEIQISFVFDEVPCNVWIVPQFSTFS